MKAAHHLLLSKMSYDHPRRRPALSVVNDAHRRTLQSECPKCRKLDIVSCIHILSYSGNILHESVLEARALGSEILPSSFS